MTESKDSYRKILPTDSSREDTENSAKSKLYLSSASELPIMISASGKISSFVTPEKIASSTPAKEAPVGEIEIEPLRPAVPANPKQRAASVVFANDLSEPQSGTPEGKNVKPSGQPTGEGSPAGITAVRTGRMIPVETSPSTNGGAPQPENREGGAVVGQDRQQKPAGTSLGQSAAHAGLGILLQSGPLEGSRESGQRGQQPLADKTDKPAGAVAASGITAPRLIPPVTTDVPSLQPQEPVGRGPIARPQQPAGVALGAAAAETALRPPAGDAGVVREPRPTGDPGAARGPQPPAGDPSIPRVPQLPSAETSTQRGTQLPPGDPAAPRGPQPPSGEVTPARGANSAGGDLGAQAGTLAKQGATREGGVSPAEPTEPGKEAPKSFVNAAQTNTPVSSPDARPVTTTPEVRAERTLPRLAATEPVEPTTPRTPTTNGTSPGSIVGEAIDRGTTTTAPADRRQQPDGTKQADSPKLPDGTKQVDLPKVPAITKSIDMTIDNGHTANSDGRAILKSDGRIESNSTKAETASASKDATGIRAEGIPLRTDLRTDTSREGKLDSAPSRVETSNKVDMTANKPDFIAMKSETAPWRAEGSPVRTDVTPSKNEVRSEFVATTMKPDGQTQIVKSEGSAPNTRSEGASPAVKPEGSGQTAKGEAGIPAAKPEGAVAPGKTTEAPMPSTQTSRVDGSGPAVRPEGQAPMVKADGATPAARIDVTTSGAKPDTTTAAGRVDGMPPKVDGAPQPTVKNDGIKPDLPADNRGMIGTKNTDQTDVRVGNKSDTANAGTRSETTAGSTRTDTTIIGTKGDVNTTERNDSKPITSSTEKDLNSSEKTDERKGRKQPKDDDEKTGPLVVAFDQNKRRPRKPESKQPTPDKSTKSQDDQRPRSYRRIKYVVRQGDTFESIAMSQLGDERFANLIITINRTAINFTFKEGIVEPILRVGQVLWLPSLVEQQVYASAIFSNRTKQSKIPTAPQPAIEQPNISNNETPLEEIQLPEVLIMSEHTGTDAGHGYLASGSPTSARIASTLTHIRFAGDRHSVSISDLNRQIEEIRLLAKLNSLSENMTTSVWLNHHLGASVPPPPVVAKHAAPAAPTQVTNPVSGSQQKQFPEFFDDTTSPIEMLSESFNDSCRVVTRRSNGADTHFNSSLQWRNGDKWITIACYEYRHGHGYRYTYSPAAPSKPFPMDLPLSVVQEMAREDFARNWAKYCRDFSKQNVGSRTGS